MLNTSATVEVTVLLNLGLTETICRFVDGHFNILVEVGDDDRSERRVLGVDLFIVNGPESVEV